MDFSRCENAGVRTDTWVVHEDDLVSAGLTDTAEHIDADVIVIGLHARAPLVERRVSENGVLRLLHRTLGLSPPRPLMDESRSRTEQPGEGAARPDGATRS